LRKYLNVSVIHFARQKAARNASPQQPHRQRSQLPRIYVFAFYAHFRTPFHKPIYVPFTQRLTKELVKPAHISEAFQLSASKFMFPELFIHRTEHVVPALITFDVYSSHFNLSSPFAGFCCAQLRATEPRESLIQCSYRPRQILITKYIPGQTIVNRIVCGGRVCHLNRFVRTVTPNQHTGNCRPGINFEV